MVAKIVDCFLFVNMKRTDDISICVTSSMSGKEAGGHKGSLG